MMKLENSLLKASNKNKEKSFEKKYTNLTVSKEPIYARKDWDEFFFRTLGKCGNCKSDNTV